MTALSVPVVVVFIILTVLAFALGARRLLGLPFSPVRTLLAGLIAFLLAEPITSAIGGPPRRAVLGGLIACVRAEPITSAIGGSAVAEGAAVLPGLWFVILGVAVALLV